MSHFARSKFFLPASWKRVFVITLVFLTVASGLFWLDYFRSYRAEVTVLVISRSNTIESGAEVAENLAEVTRTLSFYNRVLADNDLIDDSFDGYAPDKRKAFWNDAVSVRKQDKGGVFTIVALGKTREDATLLANQTAQTLFSVAGFYYNVKTEIDLRIIDGPLVGYVLMKPFWFGIMSLLSGFFVTVFFFLFLNLVPGFIRTPVSLVSLESRRSGPSLGGRRKNISLDETFPKQDIFPEKYFTSERSYPEFIPGETVPWIDPRKFIPTKPMTLSFENTAQGVKNGHSMRAPAPANLPVASDEIDFPVMDDGVSSPAFEIFPEEVGTAFPQSEEELFDLSSLDEHIAVSESMESISPESQLVAPSFGEPTAEEYKRRLNKLLSGSN